MLLMYQKSVVFSRLPWRFYFRLFIFIFIFIVLKGIVPRPPLSRFLGIRIVSFFSGYVLVLLPGYSGFLSCQEGRYVILAQGLQVIGPPGSPLTIRPVLAFSGLLRQGALWPGPLFI